MSQLDPLTFISQHHGLGVEYLAAFVSLGQTKVLL